MKHWPVALVCLILGGLGGTLVGDRVLHGQATSQAVPRELTSYRDVVKKVLPAVVSIEARSRPVKARQSPRRGQGFGDLPIPEEFRKFLEERGMPFNFEFDDGNFIPPTGMGSGFVVDPKGIILTNHHVVAGADQVEVTFPDGRKFLSKDIRVDKKTDLAIVKIEAKEPLPYLELGDSNAIEVGDRVLAAGAPFGLTGSITQGIISAKGRRNVSLNMYEDFLQTDAAINPGNSGGPLVNLEGKVIGINTAIKSRTGAFQGVGLAIPSNMAKEVYESLVKEGVVRRGYLGVAVRELAPEIAARVGAVQGGVLVSEVTEGRAADKAGIKEGDVITAVAGRPIKSGVELQQIVARLPVNKTTEVAVVRDGQPMVVPVVIEEQPEDLQRVRQRRRPANAFERGEDVSLDKLGVQVNELTEETAETLGLRGGAKGLLITEVEPDSAAALAGLRRGMVITKIDNKGVTTPQAAQKMLSKASLEKGILLQILVRTPDGGYVTEYVLVQQATADR